MSTWDVLAAVGATAAIVALLGRIWFTLRGIEEEVHHIARQLKDWDDEE